MRLLILISISLFMAVPTWAQPEKMEQIEAYLKALKKDPVSTMYRPLKRRPGFSAIKTLDFGPIDEINQVRRFYPEADYVSDFDTLTATEMKDHLLTSEIWSGDYWATYKMGLAKRYNDEKYPEAHSYETYIDYFKSLGPIDFKNPEEVMKLSPAEKYDLLVHDGRLNLTNWSLFTAQSAYTKNENDEEEAMTWAGLCHGWAPAAYRVPRPLHSVKLDLGFTEIEFLPDDIKALATLLWAQNQVPTRFLGGRCNKENPEKDELGRIQDPECFDMNPASWHTVILNQLKLREQSLVIDATYDLEVWNQPVKAYELMYFNPKTEKATRDINEALISLADHPEDIFKKYRSPNAKYVFGVVMDLAYIVETAPSDAKEDSEKRDAFNSVRYFYDIELDENKNFVGGEWYQSTHPDFIWSPIEGAVPKSWYDQRLTGQWDPTSPVPPKDWMAMAHQASRQGLPLSAIVYELVRRSRE